MRSNYKKGKREAFAPPARRRSISAGRIHFARPRIQSEGSPKDKGTRMGALIFWGYASTQLSGFHAKTQPATQRKRLGVGKEEKGSGRRTFFRRKKGRRSKADFAPTWHPRRDSNALHPA